MGTWRWAAYRQSLTITLCFAEWQNVQHFRFDSLCVVRRKHIAHMHTYCMIHVDHDDPNYCMWCLNHSCEKCFDCKGQTNEGAVTKTDCMHFHWYWNAYNIPQQRRKHMFSVEYIHQHIFLIHLKLSFGSLHYCGRIWVFSMQCRCAVTRSIRVCIFSNMESG